MPPDLPPAPDEFDEDLTLHIQGVGVVAPPAPEGTLPLEISTSRGVIRALLDPCEGQPGAVIYCSGAMGGDFAVRGPGDSVYQALAATLVRKGVTSLRLHCREPGEFAECVLDVLGACSFLRGIGATRIVLVGHSFGGAVVIKAGQLAPLVTAVAALSSQLFGTRQVEQLGKPLLLIHGSDDQVLEMAASQDIYDRAREPKRFVILEGSGHGLLQNARQLFDELEPFLLQYAGPDAPDAP